MQANSIFFGINGFGRVGRITFRVWWLYYRDQITLKAINTSGSMEIEEWFHLVKYDTSYGLFDLDITINRSQSKDEASDDNPVLGTVTIKADDGQTYDIAVTAQRDPAKIPWGKFEVTTVIESTGVFRTEEKAALHLQGGAKKVIISAPAKGEGIGTTVLGVNEVNPSEKIHSNASCTTNCVAPVTQIMHQVFGIKKAIMTTIHAYTDDQNTQDNSHKDLRRARSAAENIIPTTTGAAVATTQIIPELQGLFDGMAVRVPIATGSLSDMVFVTSRSVTVEEVNQAFIDASKRDEWKGLLAVTNDQIVSSDIIGRRESSIVDLSLTKVIDGDLVKVVSWYDNEWGYCCRLAEEVSKLG